MVEQPGHLNSSLEIVGTEGKLVVKNLVFPSKGHSIVHSKNGVDRIWAVRGLETYDHQLDAVVRALTSGVQLPTEGFDSLANMNTIDAIYTAAGIAR